MLQELLVGEREGLPRATRGSVPCGHLGLCQRSWAVSLFARWCAASRRGVACWACGLSARCGLWVLRWGCQSTLAQKALVCCFLTLYVFKASLYTSNKQRSLLWDSPGPNAREIALPNARYEKKDRPGQTRTQHMHILCLASL